MRYAFILGLGLLAGAGCSKKPAASGNDLAKPIAPQPVVKAGAAAVKDAGRGVQSIPQDVARMEKRRAELLKWNLDTLVGAYDKVGKKSPKWDESARAALALAARMFSIEIDPAASWADVAKPAKAAIDAGCDDPLVAFLYVRTRPLTSDAEARRYLDAVKAFGASRYPAWRRAGGLAIAVPGELQRGSEGDAFKKEAEAAFDGALALLPESAASDEHNAFWERSLHNTCMELVRLKRWLGMPGPAAYARVDAELAKVPELKALRLRFRGSFWLHYGWEARTQAFAPNVPPGGFETLEECLAVAKKAFEESWAIDPISETAQNLMEIDKAIGGDRATMDLWFERAMKADGDNRNACWSKLDWLDPKWHGSAEEMLAFGRECRDTKNFRSGIPLLVADAHFRIAGMPGVDQIKYMSSDEVWDDIQPVYDEYLKHRPVGDDIARSKYATFCYLSTHFREAEVQYVALGDRLTQWTEFPFVPLFQMKQNREYTARAVLGKEGSLSFPGWNFLGSKNGEGEWYVNAPAHLQKRTKPGILGADESGFWNCTANGVLFEVRAQAVPAVRRNEPPERLVEKARAELTKQRGAEPHNLRETLLAARPAQEYDIELVEPKPMQVRVKMIIIGNWLFELSVTGSQREVAGLVANEFFDSFAYQPKAK